MEASNFDLRIYHKLPQLVLGFHGCDKSVADRILCSPSEHLLASNNSYDWLGNGIYFWLNDPERACGFNLIRPLDCAVFLHLHEMMKEKGISFDTIYGYFQEGSDAFVGAGIKEKSHIQICVRNTDCIKGYFLPRSMAMCA